jgi:hypothetical protein
VDPRTGLDVLQKRKISCPCQCLKLRLSCPNPSHYFDNTTLATNSVQMKTIQAWTQ